MGREIRRPSVVDAKLNKKVWFQTVETHFLETLNGNAVKDSDSVSKRKYNMGIVSSL